MTQPLLAAGGGVWARVYGDLSGDPCFAAPTTCTARTRAEVEALNAVHRGWQSRDVFVIDSRMRGCPAPAGIVNTDRERKSPNAVNHRLRRWLKKPVSDGQAKQRASLRLDRDAVLAVIHYYELDARTYDIPTDADILMWSPKKVRALVRATRHQLSAEILEKELPEAMAMASHARPRVGLHVNIIKERDPRASSEECFVAFTKPAPFWRSVGDTMFCVPILASTGGHAALFAGPAALPRRFAARGPVRFDRQGPGRFTEQV